MPGPAAGTPGIAEHAGGDGRHPGVHPQRHLDILTGNALARALFAPIFTSPARPVNAARFTFLDPAAAEFYPDWDVVADQNVATLRAEVGRNPFDKALSDLIGELSTRGDTFRQRWVRHEVRQPGRGCTQPAGQLERHRQRRNSTQADLSTHTVGSPRSCLPIPHPDRARGTPPAVTGTPGAWCPRMLGDLPQFPDRGAEVTYGQFRGLAPRRLGMVS
jgi:hypothetical protein